MTTDVGAFGGSPRVFENHLRTRFAGFRFCFVLLCVFKFVKCESACKSMFRETVAYNFREVVDGLETNQSWGFAGFRVCVVSLCFNDVGALEGFKGIKKY